MSLSSRRRAFSIINCLEAIVQRRQETTILGQISEVKKAQRRSITVNKWKIKHVALGCTQCTDHTVKKGQIFKHLDAVTKCTKEKQTHLAMK